MNSTHDFVGELIGTFILVFFGCGSVAVTILFSAHTGLLQIALVWGIGVALAIYATRHLSCAHLNPAVTVAMAVSRRMPLRKLPIYLAGQLIGAFVAALFLYFLYSDSLAAYETSHNIVRGTPESVTTAMIFGEFYPNPGAGSLAMVSTTTAFFAEAIGTFALVFLIFSLTEGCNVGRPDDSLAPIFIGLTVTVIIAVLAPLTQAGLNPARDFAPRIFAMLAGWGKAAFPKPGHGFFTVYIAGPILGGLAASLLFTRIIEPLMSDKSNANCCQG